MMEAFESSWWYRGRLFSVQRAARALPTAPSGPALDMGAGYGGMFSLLSRFGPVDAYEPDAEARAALKRRGYRHVFDSLPRSPAQGPYAAVGMFDVLEHIEDDEAALANIRDLLAPGGVCVITVPAFPSLWSRHDVDCQHFRRYTARTLRPLLARAGFTVTYLSYWNMALFLPAYLSRKLGIVSSEGETTRLPKVLDALFSAIVSLESLLLPHIPLPFGTGLIVLARKA